MTTTTSIDGWLREILLHPGDDLYRLAYADALEERDGPGDAERAAFVRVQCRLAEIERGIAKAGDLGHLAKAIVWNEKQQLRRRERELLEWFCREDWAVEFGLPNHTTLYPVEGGLTCPGTGIDLFLRRGFVESVACKLETWTGGACPKCKGTREVTVGHRISGAVKWGCRNCRDGRVAGVGAALVACQPVTTVRGTGQEPYRSPGGGWSWYRGETPSGEHPPSDLPGSVFDALGGGNRQRHFRWYDDEAAAMADLSAALLQMAKGGDA